MLCKFTIFILNKFVYFFFIFQRFNLLDIVEEIDPNHLLVVVEVNELILLYHLIHLMFDQVHCIEGVTIQRKKQNYFVFVFPKIKYLTYSDLEKNKISNKSKK